MRLDAVLPLCPGTVVLVVLGDGRPAASPRRRRPGGAPPEPPIPSLADVSCADRPGGQLGVQHNVDQPIVSAAVPQRQQRSLWTPRIPPRRRPACHGARLPALDREQVSRAAIAPVPECQLDGRRRRRVAHAATVERRLGVVVASWSADRLAATREQGGGAVVSVSPQNGEIQTRKRGWKQPGAHRARGRVDSMRGRGACRCWRGAVYLDPVR